MVTPNTAEERLVETGKRARGFVYCVSMLGITGESKGFYGEIEKYISRVREHVSVPVALGFGIDGPEKASLAAPAVDGVVIGSAIVRLVEKYGRDRDRLLEEVKTFAISIKEAIK
jgi:tryptophan synthase alpha chain